MTKRNLANGQFVTNYSLVLGNDFDDHSIGMAAGATLVIGHQLGGPERFVGQFNGLANI